MKTVAIIQARMAASRLPNKVMLDIGGRPMLEWVVERTRRAQTIEQVVVATTTDPSDEPVVAFCKTKGYACARGSAFDVLDRYYQIAKHLQADIVVRITADCPLIDPVLVDDAVLALKGAPDRRVPRYDFVANRLPPPWGRTYPVGLDIEVFTFDALEKAHRGAIAKHQREHVTPYFYEETPAEHLRFSVPGSQFSSAMTPIGMHILLLHHDPDYGNLRWTVDTPDDLEVVRQIVARFEGDTFTWRDIVDLMTRDPALTQINAGTKHKSHLDVDKRAE